jgi:hypothetical protein
MTIDSIIVREPFDLNVPQEYTYVIENSGVESIVVFEVNADNVFTEMDNYENELDGTGPPLYDGGLIRFLTPHMVGTTRIEVWRRTDVLQLINYIAYDPFPAETHEFGLDKLTMILQEHGLLIGGLIDRVEECCQEGGDLPPGGDYIPMAGTLISDPVRGNVTFASSKGLSFNDEYFQVSFLTGDAFEGALGFIPDAAFTGPSAGENRGVFFGVSDGSTYRSGGFESDGTVRAGRPDLPVGAVPETLITKQYFDDNGGGGGIGEAPIDGTPYERQDGDWVPSTGGGAFVPLAGTEALEPVTGIIQFAEAGSIGWGAGTAYNHSWIANIDTLAFLTPAQLGGVIGNFGVSFGVEEGTTTRIIALNQDGTVQAGRPDIPGGSSQNTLVTKQYFEDNAGGGGIGDAPVDGTPYERQDAAWVSAGSGGGSFIPLAGTAGSGPVTGLIDTGFNVVFAANAGIVWTGGYSAVYVAANNTFGFLAPSDVGGGAVGTRGMSFAVEDGTTNRKIAFTNEGYVRAGRPDIDTNPNTLVTKQYFDDNSAAGDFLPLAGGELTGALLGTTAGFTGNLSCGNIINALQVQSDLGNIISASQVIINAPIPLVGEDATRKDYVDTQVATKIGDAPSDGNEYVRLNATWAIASGGGGDFLPLSGGTLTGQLNGTVAGFTGDVSSGLTIRGNAVVSTLGNVTSASQVLIGAPTPGTVDAATRKDYVDSGLAGKSATNHTHSEYSPVGHTHTEYVPKTGGTFSGQVNFGSVAISGIANHNNNRISNVGTPTQSTDAATKSYADANVAALVVRLNALEAQVVLLGGTI